MNFTAHRMNTGLSGIFNEISVGKLMKNDSFPQTTNLARINAGIAEMLFGRVNTPKGIGTYSHTIPPSRKSSLEEQKPQRGLEPVQKPHSMLIFWFGRVETPKGIGTFTRV